MRFHCTSIGYTLIQKCMVPLVKELAGIPMKCPYREVHGLIGDGLSLVGGSIPLIVLRTSMTS